MADSRNPSSKVRDADLALWGRNAEFKCSKSFVLSQWNAGTALSQKNRTVKYCRDTCKHENTLLLTSTIAGPVSAFWASSAARGFHQEHGSVWD